MKLIAPYSGATVEADGERAKALLSAGFTCADEPKPKTAPRKRPAKPKE